MNARKWPWITLGVLLAAGALVLALLLARTPTQAPGGPGKPGGGPGPAASVLDAPQKSEPLSFEPLDELPPATLWLEVHEPERLRAALFANGWAKETAGEPLGVGFAGSWAAFLGSRGEDLSADFAGTLLELVTTRLLSSPFRLIWFGGPRTSGTPALVVADPASEVRAAYSVLDRVGRKGTVEIARCVGREPPGQPEPRGDGDKPKPELILSRWTIGEHPVFAVHARGRIVLGSHPMAVLQGVCAELPPVERTTGADLEVVLQPDASGRETQLLAQLFGVDGPARLALGVEGTTLTPRGLRADLKAPGRLDVAPLPEELLRMVPEGTPVIVGAQLRLPAVLDANTLRAHFAGGGGGEALTRQAMLLWYPRGDAKAPTEVALVWSRPEDASALSALFSGANKPRQDVLCGRPVLASTDQMLERVAAACAGRTPSILHAAPAVAAGLRGKASVQLGVDLGRLLSQLTADGWRSSRKEKDRPAPISLPPEIEAAQRRLELLPFFGFTGSVENAELLPRGFRS